MNPTQPPKDASLRGSAELGALLEALRLALGGSSGWCFAIAQDGAFLGLNTTCPLPARIRALIAAECVRGAPAHPPTEELLFHAGRAAILAPSIRPALQALGLTNAHSLWSSFREQGLGTVYVGILSDSPGGPDSTERLRMLFPFLRAALLNTAFRTSTSDLDAGLKEALEQLATPAFVLSADDVVLRANGRGAALLAADRPGAMASLRAAIRLKDNALRLHAYGRLVLQEHRGAPQAQAVEEYALRCRLTRRQREVLGLLCEGMRNDQIASRLGIAVVTVEQHVSAVFKRTGSRSRAALVARALGSPGKARG